MVMQLHEKELAPSLHFRDPNPQRRLGPHAVPGQHRAARLAGRPGRRPPRRGERLRLRRHQLPRGARGVRPRSAPPGAAPRTFASAEVPRSTVPCARSRRRNRPCAAPSLLGGRDDAEVVAQLQEVAAAARQRPGPGGARPGAGATRRCAWPSTTPTPPTWRPRRQGGQGVRDRRPRRCGRCCAPRACSSAAARRPRWRSSTPVRGRSTSTCCRTCARVEPVVAATFDEADRIMTPLLGTARCRRTSSSTATTRPRSRELRAAADADRDHPARRAGQPTSR